MGNKYYAHEKVGSAVSYLAASDGPRRELLREARGRFTAVTEADMPPQSQAVADFRSLDVRMNWAEDIAGKGTLPATLLLMSEEEARAIAALIVEIYLSLTDAIIAAQRDGERWNADH